MAPRSQLTRNDIAERLEAEVHALGSTPGAKLPSERDLAQSLGVSRPLIREAMRSLVERGLVEISPGPGRFRSCVVDDRGRSPARVPLPSPEHHDAQPDRGSRDDRAAGGSARGEPSNRCRDRGASGSRRADPRLESRSRARPLGPRDPPDRLAHATQSDDRDHLRVDRAAHLRAHAAKPQRSKVVACVGSRSHTALYEAIRDRRPEDAYDAMLAHHESGRLVYDADLDSSIHEVAQRELAKLLGPSASMERVVSEILREPLLATSAFAEAAPEQRPLGRSRAGHSDLTREGSSVSLRSQPRRRRDGSRSAALACSASPARSAL